VLVISADGGHAFTFEQAAEALNNLDAKFKEA
jgi:hypothetical protein